MGVGWIDNVYVKTSAIWHFQSRNDRYNGVLDGPRRFDLDDWRMHEMTPGHYHARWCGIPWYYQGRHYKVLTNDLKKGIRFYTSEIGQDNWIIYEDVRTGLQIARQKAPKGSDFHCNLLIEDQGPSIDIVNNYHFSAENAFVQILNESRRWVEVPLPVLAQTLAKSAV